MILNQHEVDVICYVCMSSIEVINAGAFGVVRVISKVATPQMSQNPLTNSKRRNRRREVEMKRAWFQTIQRELTVEIELFLSRCKRQGQ